MQEMPINTYIQHLRRLGYAQASIYRIRMHLSWFVGLFPDEAQWNDSFLNVFLKNRNESFIERKGRSLKKTYLHVLESDVRRFLHYLGRHELQEEPAVPSDSWWERQLQQYLDFCSRHQGLGKAALWKRRYFLRKFINCLYKHSVTNGKGLCSGVIIEFIRQNTRGYSLSTVKGLNAALRGFLGYLYQQDAIERDLSCSVIGPRHYREQHIPSYLTDSRLQTLLKSIDKGSPQGFRDYCIFILLIQYGLRIKEVAELTLNDINWKEKTLLIRDRKNQGHMLLPLSEEVALVLMRYISSFRPDYNHPELFLSMKAPLRPLSCSYLSNLVRRRFYKAGIKGYAHLIRHTFARNLIEQGERLEVIQKLLGHQDISTTRIYARVNIERLREVAENDSADMVK